MALAPVGAIILFGSLLLLDPFDGPGAVVGSLVVLAAVAVMGYVAELIVVLPLLILTRRFDRIGLGACVLGGLLIGALAAVVLDRPTINLTRWRYYVASSAAGVLSAGLYWAVLTWWPAPAPDPPGMRK